ncbi:MAG: peptidylprolyl isomerase [Parvularcula sp.]|jgi:peptidylprolyl isomerase|nr:peptidylprolyl isomerase [Parvularcula sp.]
MLPAAFLALAAAFQAEWREVPPENLLLMDTDQGEVVILLSEHLAQDHVAQLRTLAREGFYNDLSFYRVIESFVAQGGDFTDQKDKGSAKDTLAAEFEEALPENAPFAPLGMSDGYAEEAGFIGPHEAGRDLESGTVWLTHCAGAFAFARSDEPDSAGAEFYITLQPQRYLDRNLTVAGKVIDGMTAIQKMPRGVIDDDPKTNDFTERGRIHGVTLASDLPPKRRPRYEVMDTQSAAFVDVIERKKARPEPFFVHRPNHVDLCQVGVPVRKID